eukprot:6457808-Amphidinium_carterae.1
MAACATSASIHLRLGSRSEDAVQEFRQRNGVLVHGVICACLAAPQAHQPAYYRRRHHACAGPRTKAAETLSGQAPSTQWPELAKRGCKSKCAFLEACVLT